MKFRVLAGTHIEQDLSAAKIPDGSGGLKHPERFHQAVPHPDGSWTPSAPFESASDLLRLNSPISTKFERVHDEVPASKDEAIAALPPTVKAWDSEKETWEEFKSRMEADKAKQPQTVAEAAKQGYQDAINSGSKVKK